MIVALMGKPGSGKSTIGRLVTTQLGWYYLSTGEIARKMAEEDPLTDDLLGIGAMAPEAEMRRRVRDELETHDHIILDGMPRHPDQVNWLWSEAIGPVICILIDISDEEARERLKARGRADDIAHTINRRLHVFRKQTMKAVKLAEQEFESHTIKGNQRPEAIASQICDIIGG